MKFSLVCIFFLLISGCSSKHSITQRVSENNYKRVTVIADTNSEPLRFWATQKPSFLLDENNISPIKVSSDQLAILAVSGGGVNGAYGAGIVAGLIDANKMPEYSIITGVSAGALLSPFIFVHESSAGIKASMVGINDRAILGYKNYLRPLFKDAFTTGEKFLSFISEAYDETLIAKVAVQHNAGRRLFIGTTQFDSGELVIWNMGAIAASNLENKAQLFQQILVASASIPGVFPPQFFQVNDEEEIVEELHVDGGMAAQVFYNPSGYSYDAISKSLGLTKPVRLDVIRNGLITPTYEQLDGHGMTLLKRSLTSMPVMQARGDLFRMQYVAENDNTRMRMTFIDQDFSKAKKTNDLFDSHYLEAIFKFGYEKAQQEDLWQENALMKVDERHSTVTDH